MTQPRPQRSCVRAARTARLGLGLGLGLMLGLMLAPGLATAAGNDKSHAAKEMDRKRDEWVSKYDALKSKHDQLQASLDQAKADYSRGRSSQHLRGEGKAGLLKEIERLEKELAETDAELEGFPDEARRAGAMPGWFREDDTPAAADEEAEPGVRSRQPRAGGSQSFSDRRSQSRSFGDDDADVEEAESDDDGAGRSISDRRATKRERRKLD